MGITEQPSQESAVIHDKSPALWAKDKGGTPLPEAPGDIMLATTQGDVPIETFDADAPCTI